MRQFLALFLALTLGFAPHPAFAVLKGSSAATGTASITSGTITLSAGAAGTPSLTFGDSTTGLYRYAANYLGVTVSGVALAAFGANAFVPAVNGSYDLGAISFGWKRLYMDFTNTGTVGAVTISKPSGRVNIAAAGTSIVVTNTLVTAAAHVMAVASTNDATCWVKSVVPAAGSFTLTTNAACTAQTSFDFFVVNAD